MSRAEKVLAMRGEPKGKPARKSAEELFHHKVIKPILEIQKEIIVEVFNKFVNDKQSGFEMLPLDKKIQLAANKVNNDILLKKLLLGTVVGMMTVEEYSKYLDHEESLSQRVSAGILRAISDGFF